MNVPVIPPMKVIKQEERSIFLMKALNMKHLSNLVLKESPVVNDEEKARLT